MAEASSASSESSASESSASAQSSARVSRELEEEGFHHEAALNAAWTGSRLALGGMTFLFGSFVFAFFYLRSLNSHGMWYPSSFTGPRLWSGTLIVVLVLASAVVQYLVLQALKAGRKAPWMAGAALALLLGLAAIGVQLWQLATEPFWPASSGMASVFSGGTPVLVVFWFGAMVWLEILIMQARQIPEISFVEQPPTYQEAFHVQRFQARLSAFTVVWNYLALVAVLFWILFYFVK
jgi:heme/copper-type cytochrome/quinol oxidase subunit 3